MKKSKWIKNKSSLSLIWFSVVGLLMTTIAGSSPKNKDKAMFFDSFAPAMYSLDESYNAPNRMIASESKTDTKNGKKNKRWTYTPKLRATELDSFKYYKGPEENISKDYISNPYYVPPNLEVYRFNFGK